MKHLFGLGIVVSLVLAVAGCPKGNNVRLYRSLSEQGAMQTCDANTRFRAEAEGASAAEAKATAEAKVRDSVTQNKGCGALIWNEGAGRKLDGRSTYVADYQLCRCP